MTFEQIQAEIALENEAVSQSLSALVEALENNVAFSKVWF